MKRQINDGTVYSAIIALCEQLEHEGSYTGNGHHLAQKLAQAVVQQPDMAKMIADYNEQE